MDVLTVKLISVIVLAVLSLFCGFLPLYLKKYIFKNGSVVGRKRQSVLSFLLCFGAGVLLAAVMIHMLPEVREGFGRVRTLKESRNSPNDHNHHDPQSSNHLSTSSLKQDHSHDHFQGRSLNHGHDTHKSEHGAGAESPSSHGSGHDDHTEHNHDHAGHDHSSPEHDANHNNDFTNHDHASHDQEHANHDHDHTNHDHDHTNHDHDHTNHDHDHTNHDHDYTNHDLDHSDHDNANHGHDHSNHDHDHANHSHDHANHDHDHANHNHDHANHNHDHANHNHDHTNHNHDHTNHDHTSHDHKLHHDHPVDDQNNIGSENDILNNNQEELHKIQNHPNKPIQAKKASDPSQSSHDHHNHSVDHENSNHDHHENHTHDHDHKEKHDHADGHHKNHDHAPDHQGNHDHVHDHAHENHYHVHDHHNHAHENHDHAHDHHETNDHAPDHHESHDHTHDNHANSHNSVIHGRSFNHDIVAIEAPEENISANDTEPSEVEPTDLISENEDTEVETPEQLPTDETANDENEMSEKTIATDNNNDEDLIAFKHIHPEVELAMESGSSVSDSLPSEDPSENQAEEEAINGIDSTIEPDFEEMETTIPPESFIGGDFAEEYITEENYDPDVTTPSVIVRSRRNAVATPEAISDSILEDKDHDHNDPHDHQDNHGHDHHDHKAKSDGLHGDHGHHEHDHHHEHSYPLTELFICAGFFLVYFIEEIVDKLFGSKNGFHGHSHGIAPATNGHLPTHSNGKLPEESVYKKGFGHRAAWRPAQLEGVVNPAFAGDPDAMSWNEQVQKNAQASFEEFPKRYCSTVHLAEQEEPKPKEKKKESCGQFILNNLRSFLMVLAISFHSTFEGLAIGLQENNGDVIYLSLAVAAHKLVIHFSIGLELVTIGASTGHIIFYTIAMALTNPIGASLGMFLTSNISYFNDPDQLFTITALQALAGGTILYVVFLEILERERSKPGGRMTKFLGLLIGFAFLAIIENFGQHSHGPVEADHR